MVSTLLREFSSLYWITEVYSIWICSIFAATVFTSLFIVALNKSIDCLSNCMISSHLFSSTASISSLRSSSFGIYAIWFFWLKARYPRCISNVSTSSLFLNDTISFWNVVVLTFISFPEIIEIIAALNPSKSMSISGIRDSYVPVCDQ